MLKLFIRSNIIKNLKKFSSELQKFLLNKEFLI